MPLNKNIQSATWTIYNFHYLNFPEARIEPCHKFNIVLDSTDMT